MAEGQYKGKLLVLKIITTLLVILFITMPYFSSIPRYVGSIMLPITLITYFVLESLFRKNSVKNE